jgi:outer membrane protein assembly factor BamA
MNVLLVAALLCPATDAGREPLDSTTMRTPRKENSPCRVGNIFIIGNTRTKMSVILEQVDLYPGQILIYPEIRIAERNLRRLNIFKNTPDGATRPTIIVEDMPGDPDGEYKDVIIKVEEDETFGTSLKCGVNIRGDCVIRMSFEERNFDPFRFPTSCDDLFSGNAFRGAGLHVGVNIDLKLISWPMISPSISLGVKLPGIP